MYTFLVSALDDITLAVLAGGEGSRMGGPKSLLTVGGRPILEYLIDKLDWPGLTILVTAPGRERPPGADQFDREAVDPVAGLGPLRGVLTAVESVNTSMLAIVTVDMPGVRGEHIAWLVGRMEDEPGCVGAMCEQTVNGQVRIEPFPLVLRNGVVGSVRAALESGRRSVHGLLRMPGFKTFAAPADWPASVWTNLNSPQDLQAWNP
jgi:molybdopterin-guanine dinucleotide biosynthesis protein A